MVASRSSDGLDRAWPASVEARTVVSVLAKELEIERHHVSPLARLVDDLGMTPLQLVGVALALEARFDIELVEADVSAFRTVEDVVACVIRGRKARHARSSPPR